MRRSLRTARPSSRWRRRRTGRCAAPWSSRRRRGRVRRWHSGKYAERGRARESPARNRPSLVKGSSPGKDFILRTGCAIDGEAPASRDGAADRPRADDDALPPGRGRGAPTPCGACATIRRTRATDRDALQRSSAGAVQAILLQEVSRVPPPLRQRPGSGGTRPRRRDVYHLWLRSAISVSPGAVGAPSVSAPTSIRGRHVDFASPAGQVLAQFEYPYAEAEEDDGGQQQERENREVVEAGEARIQLKGQEDSPGDFEPIGERDRFSNRLPPRREDREREEDAAEDVEDAGDGLRESLRVPGHEERRGAKGDANGQEDEEAEGQADEEQRQSVKRELHLDSVGTEKEYAEGQSNQDGKHRHDDLREGPSEDVHVVGNRRDVHVPDRLVPLAVGLDDLERPEQGRADEDEERVPDVQKGERVRVRNPVDRPDHDVHEDQNERSCHRLDDRVDDEKPGLSPVRIHFPTEPGRRLEGPPIRAH